MGYRSEVAFVVPSTAPKFEEVEKCFDEVIERDGYRLYTASWLKWYDDYPVVQAVESYLSELSDEDKDDQFLFIRLGESAEDVDEEGCFWENPFNLGWARSINFC